MVYPVDFGIKVNEKPCADMFDKAAFPKALIGKSRE
jgi:hypothetical protein